MFPALIAVMVAASLYSAYSSYQQGQQARQMSEIQMEVERRKNETRRLVNEENIAIQKRKNEAALAKQRFVFGLSGADVQSGSLLASQLQTKEEMAHTEAYMAWQRDVGYETGLTDVSMIGYRGRQAEAAAYTQGVGNLLSGVTKAAGTYAMYSTPTSTLQGLDSTSTMYR